ncbi:reverse transcriptase family protein [Friedmanniella luteola]|uniref:reverse transcriptase family protein n=1 Tax=Friedmanniella luteola TaxID=546871 RepID=UPI0012FD44BF|nr:reverse transcriptase family protein [Friedmanniella luteola]
MKRRDPTAHVARALAWSFLAAPDWTEAALRRSAWVTLGRRHRWVSALAGSAVATYRTAPLGRPHELAGLLAGSAVLTTALHRAARRGTPVRVRVLPTTPAAMGRRRWPVPEVDDGPALARLLQVPDEQLSWLADVQGRQRRTPAGPHHLYRYRWVARPGTVPRLLEAPTPLLRHVLRRLLDEVLVWVPAHPAAHGFVRGRSVLSHARRHVGADLVLGLDLRHFFAAVTAARVAGLWTLLGYPEGVVTLLTGLTTHRTPVHVLTAMPPGGDVSGRHLLRARLRAAHLPQGAASSPALANLACFTLDHRLSGYAAALGATYSRYADDLTFSGPRDLPAARLVRSVTTVVAEEGFAVNPTKTRVQRSSARQQVTGLVVNAGLGIPREDEDRLRAVLHDAVRRGPQAANRDGVPDFRAHLEGRVGWVTSVNPVRGARLRRQLEAVVWPPR